MARGAKKKEPNRRLGINPVVVDQVKPKMGRPPKYRPEYCERVIELAKQGDGWAAYASEFEVDRATLYKWMDQHEDFRTAMMRAKVEEQHWWENAGKSGLFAERFNAQVWTKSAQARFRDDYTEKKITEVSGIDGKPIEMQTKVIDVSNLDAERREQLRQLLLAMKEGTNK